MAGFASGAQGGIAPRTLDRLLGNRNLVAPRNTRIALFGPSHAANHFNLAANPTTGQGALPSASIQGPVHWANVLSGGRAVHEPADNFGYNGDWTDAMTWNGVSYPGMLSRVDQVIASGAGHVVMAAPTSNDRNGWTAAQTIANMQTIVSKITAAGMLLTILLDYPHGATAYPNLRLPNTAANPQLDYWQMVNRWMWSLHGQKGVRVVDTPAILADFTAGSGQAQPNVTIEGLHLTGLGGYMVGRVLAREWRRIYPALGVLPFGSSEAANQPGVNTTPILSQQPYFGGTAGTLTAGATGSVANSWTMSLSSGMAAAYSKVTTSAFNARSYADDEAGPLSKDWQQIVLSGTATGIDEVAILRQQVSCSVGDLLRAVAEIEVDGGVTGIAGFSLYIYHNTSGQQVRQLGVPTAAVSIPWPSVPITGVWRTPRWTADSTSFYLQLAARPINGATIAGTVRVRGMAAGKSLAL